MAPTLFLVLLPALAVVVVALANPVQLTLLRAVQMVALVVAEVLGLHQL
jgi:hypothetical protein